MLQILKLGGSVITDKSKHTTAKKETIERLVKEIASAKNKKDFKLVLVNGAGSFGHTPVKEYDLKEGIMDEKTKKGFTIVHKYVENLNRIIWDALGENGLIAMPVHPTCFIIQDDWKIVKFDTDVIEGLLEHDIVPLLYGDMVIDKKQGCSIISGDDIVPYLAKKLEAKRILMGSNTDGIYDKDPNLFPDAKLIPEINNENYEDVLSGLTGSAKTDVTGGMKEKIRKLIEMTKETECLIFNAEKEGLTEKALLEEKVGTLLTIS
ncbi:MAG: isopentenyl phosphate kinase family protein [Candidatus Aenigmarchaeota archaeon]|nr:isopentenyl phosphate kinase family protein [Candidatus Aenigmarchaeota archaeon]